VGLPPTSLSLSRPVVEFATATLLLTVLFPFPPPPFVVLFGVEAPDEDRDLVPLPPVEFTQLLPPPPPVVLGPCDCDGRVPSGGLLLVEESADCRTVFTDKSRGDSRRMPIVGPLL